MAVPEAARRDGLRLDVHERGDDPDTRAALGGLQLARVVSVALAVERMLSWLHQFRRLRIRWERRADLHEGLLKLAVCLICWRSLQRLFSQGA